MKSVKIEIPKGYKVDEDKSTFEQIVFKKVELRVVDRIKTVADVFSELGDNCPEVLEYRKLQKADVASYILNTQLAVCIARCLNESWTPDWTNSSEYKYYPWIDMKTGKYDTCAFWHAKSTCSSRLSFRTPELAKYAATQFQEVWSGMMRG